MPLYQVTWAQKIWFCDEVEAENETEALEKAQELKDPFVLESEYLDYSEIEKVMK